jgi:hypothetical protein
MGLSLGSASQPLTGLRRVDDAEPTWLGPPWMTVHVCVLRIFMLHMYAQIITCSYICGFFSNSHAICYKVLQLCVFLGFLDVAHVHMLQIHVFLLYYSFSNNCESFSMFCNIFLLHNHFLVGLLFLKCYEAFLHSCNIVLEKCCKKLLHIHLFIALFTFSKCCGTLLHSFNIFLEKL